VREERTRTRELGEKREKSYEKMKGTLPHSLYIGRLDSVWLGTRTNVYPHPSDRLTFNPMATEPSSHDRTQAV
jgi:hypothetical protein